MKRFRAEEYWEYFDYALDIPVKVHYLHTEDDDIVLHCSEFLPPNPIACAYVSHGYFDHSSWMLPLIEGLATRGFRVIVYDLPGHGLSTGERGGIKHFRDYSYALKEVHQRFHDPFLSESFFGFSTGCVGWIDWALLRETDLGGLPPFEKVFLLAPLIKVIGQRLSRLPQWIGPLIGYQFPRKPSKRAMLDPLSLMSINTNWLSSLRLWNVELENARASYPHEVHYWSGAFDLTVDWHYNRRFLSRHLDLRERIFPKSGHRLLDDASVLGELFSFLDQSN